MADDEDQVPIGSSQIAEPAPAPATGPSGPPTPALPTMPDINPLVEAHRNYMGEASAVRDATTVQLARDRARAERAFSATGIQPGELQAWDHERQSEKYRTDPIEAFGSLGSVFAMVASAFTRAPMDNALNGAAAAMNAVRAGNEQEFDRAYKAWQANTDLAMKRHSIQQNYYSNAIDMMKNNTAAGEAQMRMVAARFGDEQMQFLLSQGLHKESIDLFNSRVAGAEKIRELQQNLTLDTWRNESVKYSFQRIDEAGMDPNTAAAYKLDAINNAYGKGGTPQQRMLTLLLAEHAGEPFDKVLEIAQQRGLIPRAAIMEGRIAAEEKVRRYEQYKRENIAAGMDPDQAATEAFNRSQAEVNDAGAKMTGNQISAQQKQIDDYKISIDAIDRLNGNIAKNLTLGGPVGTPGYIKRATEKISNLFGRDSVEYQSIAGDIALLKTWAPRNLLGRDGRPLSAEHANLDRVIQGLGFTDTAQGTMATFKKIRELYARMQQEAYNRLHRNQGPRATPSLGGGGGMEMPPPARAPSYLDGILVE